MKHALAEEGAAQADAIEPADEVVILPDLDAVGVSEFVQPDIEIADALVDPGVVAARLRRRAAGDDRLERAVDGDREGVGAHRARQARGDAKAVERNHAAHFRLDPEQRRIVGALGHREDAAGIGAQQHFGRDVGRGGVARCHGWQDSRTKAKNEPWSASPPPHSRAWPRACRHGRTAARSGCRHGRDRARRWRRALTPWRRRCAVPCRWNAGRSWR